MENIYFHMRKINKNRTHKNLAVSPCMCLLVILYQHLLTILYVHLPRGLHQNLPADLHLHLTSDLYLYLPAQCVLISKPISQSISSVLMSSYLLSESLIGFMGLLVFCIGRRTLLVVLSE